MMNQKPTDSILKQLQKQEQDLKDSIHFVETKAKGYDMKLEHVTNLVAVQKKRNMELSAVNEQLSTLLDAVTAKKLMAELLQKQTNWIDDMSLYNERYFYRNLEMMKQYAIENCYDSERAKTESEMKRESETNINSSLASVANGIVSSSVGSGVGIDGPEAMNEDELVVLNANNSNQVGAQSQGQSQAQQQEHNQRQSNASISNITSSRNIGQGGGQTNSILNNQIAADTLNGNRLMDVNGNTIKTYRERGTQTKRA